MLVVGSEDCIEIDLARLVFLRRGAGKPLLILHDELGFPGWMRWNEELSEAHEQIVPLQPGFGRSEQLDWVRDYRDLAAYYARFVRQFGTPIDVVGFSAGAFLAAEMAAIDPGLFNKIVLVGPLGVRPTHGEIYDFLAVTARTHVAATVSNQDAPEFSKIYGGTMGSEQFMLFEAARAETSRLGWEPFMFDPSLPALLKGVPNKTLIIRGTDDLICPLGCVEAYESALPNAVVSPIEGVGHRPEIEDPDTFIQLVRNFLS
jgi:pimeloyl-ACP methyl ester carboxylesterase